MQSPVIIIWPADMYNNVYNMELRTSSMHCDLAQHHIFVRQSKTGMGRAACTIPTWSRGKAFGTCIPDTQAPCIRAGDRHILYTAGECDGGQSPTCTADNRSKRLINTAQLQSRQLINSLSHELFNYYFMH